MLVILHRGASNRHLPGLINLPGTASRQGGISAHQPSTRVRDGRGLQEKCSPPCLLEHVRTAEGASPSLPPQPPTGPTLHRYTVPSGPLRGRGFGNVLIDPIQPLPIRRGVFCGRDIHPVHCWYTPPCQRGRSLRGRRKRSCHPAPDLPRTDRVNDNRLRHLAARTLCEHERCGQGKHGYSGWKCSREQHSKHCSHSRAMHPIPARHVRRLREVAPLTDPLHRADAHCDGGICTSCPGRHA